MKLFKIEPGQEVMSSLKSQLAEAGIDKAAIVSIIGAVDSCCISNMPKKDASKDILSEYAEPMEISGCGEVQDGAPHIHCVLGREGDSTISGHLHWARVEAWFVKVFVIEF